MAPNNHEASEPRRFSDGELLEMKQRIDETWKCVSEISTTLALHVQSCEARDTQIDRHEKLLRGEGDDSKTDGGLVGAVRDLQKWKAALVAFGTMSVSSLAWLIGGWFKRKMGLE